LPVLANAATGTSELGAFEQAEVLLDDAGRRGRWTTSEGRNLRDMLPHLSDSHRDAILKRLAIAINQGQLRVETGGLPPF
jgi:hypothetical protein